LKTAVNKVSETLLGKSEQCFFKGLEKELFEMSNSKRFAQIRRKRGIKRREREREKFRERLASDAI
jgi:hypothetical protein